MIVHGHHAGRNIWKSIGVVVSKIQIAPTSKIVNGISDILDECPQRQYRDRKMEALSKKSKNHSPNVELSPVNDVIPSLDLGKYRVWTQKSIGYQ